MSENVSTDTRGFCDFRILARDLYASIGGDDTVSGRIRLNSARCVIMFFVGFLGFIVKPLSVIEATLPRRNITVR